MHTKSSETLIRQLLISLIALVSLTGCLEDPRDRPAHAIVNKLGAKSGNILLDFPSATLGGSGPYCIYFLSSKKIDATDLDRVLQSLPYSVTLEQRSTLETVENSLNTSCGIGSLKSNGHRSKIKLDSYKLLSNSQPVSTDVPVTKWMISGMVIGSGLSVTAYITQIEYTPATAILQINGKLITGTLVIVDVL